MASVAPFPDENKRQLEVLVSLPRLSFEGPRTAGAREVASFLNMVSKVQLGSLNGGIFAPSLTELEDLLPLLSRIDGLLSLKGSDVVSHLLLQCCQVWVTTLTRLQSNGRTSFERCEDDAVNPKLNDLVGVLGKDATFSWNLGANFIPESDVQKLATIATANQKELMRGDSTLREVQMVLVALSKSDVAAIVMVTWKIFKVRLSIASLQHILQSEGADLCSSVVQEAVVVVVGSR